MKRMKKTISLAVVLMMVLALTACGRSKNDKDENDMAGAGTNNTTTENGADTAGDTTGTNNQTTDGNTTGTTGNGSAAVRGLAGDHGVVLPAGRDGKSIRRRW